MYRLLSGLLALALLGACQAPAPQPQTPAAPAALPVAPPGNHVYTLDPSASDLRIYVFRDGPAARAGHNHVFTAPTLSGHVEIPSDKVADAAFAVGLRLDSLVVDVPSLLADTGGSFIDRPRSETDRAGTLRNLRKSLDTDTWPLLTLQSRQIRGDWPVLIADVAIQLHGVTRVQPVMMTVLRSDTEIRAQGQLVIHQRDFGITPFAIFGGLLAVQNGVAIRFDLVARR